LLLGLDNEPEDAGYLGIVRIIVLNTNKKKYGPAEPNSVASKGMIQPSASPV